MQPDLGGPLAQLVYRLRGLGMAGTVLRIGSGCFSALSQCFPTGTRLFSTFPVQVRRCHLLLESALLLCAAVHEDDSSLLMVCRFTCCYGRWETTPILPGVQA